MTISSVNNEPLNSINNVLFLSLLQEHYLLLHYFWLMISSSHFRGITWTYEQLDDFFLPKIQEELGDFLQPRVVSAVILMSFIQPPRR